ncbi:AN1-type zinc finger protein 1 [Erpetoichthys calabaricus]|uniref:AN1-type zinc finger protein 1 n=1 Tax=Erpetoichthys calabaricus TaxID=27687 RepID=UPI00109F8B3F|nr:AN1-type zinc finger protein 1 [Erpetoichthys calabaricus]
MAELDIGKHCSVRECNLKDFLPFVCDGCSGVYCLEHRSRDSHCCSQISVKKQCVKSEQSTSYPCNYQGCFGKEPLPVVCQHCEKHFCLAHRHQQDHDCEKLQIPKPRMAATQQLVKDILESKKSALPGKKRKGAKNSETAAKVALMKLKLHAVGDKALPQTERIYFQVYLPKGSAEKSKPMFFSSRWSVGRVVDYAASLAGLKNNNNILTAKKLRLCHPLSGEALPMDQTLESWISRTECPLYTGGNIIFEYLDNDIKGLEDADSYFVEP